MPFSKHFKHPEAFFWDLCILNDSACIYFKVTMHIVSKKKNHSFSAIRILFTVKWPWTWATFRNLHTFVKPIHSARLLDLRPDLLRHKDECICLLSPSVMMCAHGCPSHCTCTLASERPPLLWLRVVIRKATSKPVASSRHSTESSLIMIAARNIYTQINKMKPSRKWR